MDQDWAALPLFEHLPRTTVQSLGAQARRHDLGPNMPVIREGEAAASLFFLARGKARVTRHDSATPIGELEAPTVFGEMALVAATPRLASVLTSTPSVLFEVPAQPLIAACGGDPKLRDLILGFHRDRLRRNVLAVSPIFSALDEARMRTLAAAFTPVTVGAGTTLLSEGAPGSALFILLRGRCEVRRGASVVANLAEGDLFGEISLALFDRPCTATVAAVTEVVVLQLSKENFQRLIMSDTEMRSRIMQLALSRLNDPTSGETRKPAIF